MNEQLYQLYRTYHAKKIVWAAILQLSIFSISHAQPNPSVKTPTKKLTAPLNVKPGTKATQSINTILAGVKTIQQVWLKTADTPMVYRWQFGTYNAQTHLYNAGYVDYNYTVTFFVDSIYFERGGRVNQDAYGHVDTQEGVGTITGQHQVTPGQGVRGVENFIQRWGLHVIAMKDGKDYPNVKFDTYYQNVGAYPPPYITVATVQGEGDYIFYTVQTFPDSSTMYDMLKGIFAVGTDANDLNALIEETIQKYKNENLLAKTIFKPIARFSAKKDFLIASLGDSYSSGEGNPEACGEISHPSIFGKAIRFLAETAVTGGVEIASLQPPLGGESWKGLVGDAIGLITGTYYGANNDLTITLTGDDCPSCRDATVLHQQGYLKPCDYSVDPLWVEAGAHRSYRSGTAMAAFEIEKQNYGVATTFLSFATSGAVVQNLMTINQNTWQEMDQIDELKRAVGTRTIDALVISIGLNDINFHGDIEDLILKNRTPDEVKRDVELEIQQLKQNYDKLEQTIKVLLKTNRVYILEYPTPLFSKKASDGTIYYDGSCGVLSQFGGHYSISVEEANLLHNLGRDLNNAIKEEAIKNGWIYVGGISDEFEGHGYCSDDPYYVEATTSCLCQGDTNGELHPNGIGHAIVAKHLIQVINQNQALDASHPILNQ